MCGSATHGLCGAAEVCEAAVRRVKEAARSAAGRGAAGCHTCDAAAAVLLAGNTAPLLLHMAPLAPTQPACGLPAACKHVWPPSSDLCLSAHERGAAARRRRSRQGPRKAALIALPPQLGGALLPLPGVCGGGGEGGARPVAGLRGLLRWVSARGVLESPQHSALCQAPSTGAAARSLSLACYGRCRLAVGNGEQAVHA